LQNLLRRSCLASVSVLLLLGIVLLPPVSRAASKESMRSLDEQVQEIKSDVLGIAAELSRLEERLLYPSNTQVAVFVSMPEDDAFRLDSVQVHIDGELVTHHIYTFKELEALEKGGVQRLFTGNLTTGSHRLDVSVSGKQRGGGDLAHSESFTFEKGVEPKLVGLTLAGSGGIRLGSW
jgi:hypothetical protein